ncbi:hypothetical protein [Amycolatopsis sp. NPDC051716]|jgi:hypothetical protein|uniref:hypothetical protein n=1 Tax=Amycolatopsis sp. NPDC051716 TaxID=3155804 RepID=UPI00341E95CE
MASRERADDAGDPDAEHHEDPRILTSETVTAHRVSVYLHPDDARVLRQGRVDDGADANTRIRALLAVYRADDRVRERVDALARSASRRGRH